MFGAFDKKEDRSCWQSRIEGVLESGALQKHLVALHKISFILQEVRFKSSFTHYHYDMSYLQGHIRDTVRNKLPDGEYIPLLWPQDNDQNS